MYPSPYLVFPVGESRGIRTASLLITLSTRTQTVFAALYGWWKASIAGSLGCGSLPLEAAERSARMSRYMGFARLEKALGSHSRSLPGV